MSLSNKLFEFPRHRIKGLASKGVGGLQDYQRRRIIQSPAFERKRPNFGRSTYVNSFSVKKMKIIEI
jgi:hypothetical protein